MEENAVQEGVEQTAPEVSQTSDSNQSQTGSQTEAEASSTSEVVKTQGDGQGDETVKEALKQVQSEKGTNRVQELANRLREAEERENQLRNVIAAVQAQAGNNPQAVQPYMDQIVLQQMQIQAERQRLLEDKLAFAQAERQFPELDKTSDRYNPKFDNLVFKLQKSGMDPVEAAREAKELMDAGKSEGLSTIQRVEAEKGANSNVQRKAAGTTIQDEAKQAARDQYKRSGKLEDLMRII
jgi:hypothetical protein